MNREIIEPKEMKVERLPYPEQEIEHLVSQIIRLSDERKHSDYDHQISETINILNEMLKMMTKPLLVYK